MNIETTQKVLMPSHSQPGIQVSGATSMGGAHPPRNMMDAIADSRIMLAYSPKKKSAKPIPEYSTMGPATISDSPSTTSKGWRLVSATAEITYTTNKGNKGSQFQEKKFTPLSANIPLSWLITIPLRFKVPDTNKTVTSTKPIASS